jgi:hypothetical protein
MPSFSLITEGLTDQVLITFLLNGYYEDDLDVTEAQPLRDETDESRQANHAGWENVLNYCRSEFFEQQFFTNDYVIIQIDTDICGHKNFDIPLKIGNKDRPTNEIIKDVKQHIIDCIGHAIYQKYSERIIFAISIHSLECWLLPLYGKTNLEKERVRKCEKHITDLLKRFDIAYEKKYRAFQVICKPLLAKQKILTATTFNESLDRFVASLP